MTDFSDPARTRRPRTAVLLHHRLPTGECHYDWMILIPGTDPPRLATFRVAAPIDRAGRSPCRFRAERIGDHRAAYLEHEGPVSGGRGEVTRTAEGDLVITLDGEARFEATGTIGGARGTWRGVRATDGMWDFEFVPGPARR